MNPIDTDHLALWPLLCDHLDDKQACPDLRHVRTVFDMQETASRGELVDRCAYVKFAGARKGGTDGVSEVIWYHRYEIAIASKFSRPSKGRWRGDPVGPVLAQVLRHVQGWAPDDLPGPAGFEPTTPPSPRYDFPGWALYFLAFEIPVPTEGYDDEY